MTDVIDPLKPALVVGKATILAGQSLSGTIDLTQHTLMMIIVPPNWTGAYLSFQVSLDGVIWGDLYEGTSEFIRVIPSASAFILPPELTQCAFFLKLRSGTRAKPVAQKQDSVFQLALEKLP